MIDAWKPVGAFIENTIRPLLDQTKWLLDEADKKGIKITEQSIRRSSDYFARAYFRYILISATRDLLVVGLICWTALKLCRT